MQDLNLCNSTIAGETPSYCKRGAGEDTDHPGEGPCSDHDEISLAMANVDRRTREPAAHDSRRMYVAKTCSALSDKLEALGGDILYHDPDGRVADLSWEIAAGRALAMQMIEDYDAYLVALHEWGEAGQLGDMPVSHVSAKDVESMLLTVSRIAGLSKQIQDYVPLRTVAGVFQAQAEALDAIMRNDNEREAVKRVFMDLTAVFRSPYQTPDGIIRIRGANQKPSGRKPTQKPPGRKPRPVKPHVKISKGPR